MRSVIWSVLSDQGDEEYPTRAAAIARRDAINSRGGEAIALPGTAYGALDFHTRFPNWERDVAEYVAKMAQISPERRRHAGCDHAYGICSG